MTFVPGVEQTKLKRHDFALKCTMYWGSQTHTQGCWLTDNRFRSNSGSATDWLSELEQFSYLIKRCDHTYFGRSVLRISSIYIRPSFWCIKVVFTIRGKNFKEHREMTASMIRKF